MDTNEREVRALRDSVYGPCTEENWNAVRDNWMRPDSVEWLKEQSDKARKQQLGLNG